MERPSHRKASQTDHYSDAATSHGDPRLERPILASDRCKKSTKKTLATVQKRKASVTSLVGKPRCKRQKLNAEPLENSTYSNGDLTLKQPKLVKETVHKTRKAVEKKGKTLKPKRENKEKSLAKSEQPPVDNGSSEKLKKEKKEPVSEMKPVVTAGQKLSAKANKYVGAHVSIVGGLHKAVLEAVTLGARAFGMFLRSQRQWASKPLEDKPAKKFKDTLAENGFSPNMVVPHGSYLLNCGAPNAEILEKSRAGLTDELQRCEKLGLTIFNFHPGSTCKKISREKCIELIAESIDIAHSKTKYVTAVLENMSGQGGTIGGKFSELAAIISLVKDKSRVGVCFDTCHAFAAGYDLSTELGYNETMEEFDQVVGFQYLRAVHVNDSQGKLGCNKDRHENIGRGKLGLDAFRRLMNDPRFNNVPFVLETPETDYSKEISKLYRLCKT